MKIVRAAFASAAVLAALACSAPASATTTTIALPDLIPPDPGGNPIAPNLGQTYTGNGFVGLRSTGDFIHAFPLEFAPHYSTRALAEIDISAFSGATINSATLSFAFLDHAGVLVYDMTAIGFVGTGGVGYQFDAPPVTLSSITGSIGPGANSLDVTTLVADAVATHASWLDLLTEGSACCELTWTQTDVVPGRTADSALVRLTVDYTPAGPVGDAAPEPSTWAMLIMGFAGLGVALRVRRSQAPAV